MDNNERVKQILELNPNLIRKKFINRADGRIEWVCKHGIGHTVYSPDEYFVHGCDFCCKGIKLPKDTWTLEEGLKNVENFNQISKREIISDVKEQVDVFINKVKNDMDNWVGKNISGRNINRNAVKKILHDRKGDLL